MMETLLIEKLRSYIIENNLDLLLQLQENFGLTKYLEDKVAGIAPQLEIWISEGKPQYVIEELSLQELTRELRPSKFNYIKEVLETEFLQTYKRFNEMGVLTYEIINIIQSCKSVFDELGFTEDTEDQKTLRYAITGAIQEYLES